MTRRQIIGGVLAVATVFGFGALVVATSGWAFWAFIIALIIVCIFMAGAALAS